MKYYALDHEATMEDIEKLSIPNMRLGVIAEIRNDNNELLLQLRGTNSSDEKGKYEHVGGKVEKDDKNFKEAIIREIKEEVGEDVELEISDSIGLFYCPKENGNWLFIIYSFKYLKGEFKIMEPGKCQGYNFLKAEDIINIDNVSESCKFLVKTLHTTK